MSELSEGITAVSSIVHKSGHRLEQSNVNLPPSNRFRENKTSPDNVLVPNGDISYAKLQTRNDQLSSLATTIRSANKIMGDIARIIGEKQEEIIQYEKQYPPFQNQSSEKVKFLNSIASLKKQVDALTLVPDNKELTSIISDMPGKDDSGKEVSLYPVGRHEVHTGSNGLNIASFNPGATDLEIRQYGHDLALASYKLDQKRSALAEDAKAIFHAIASDAKHLGKEILESGQEATSKSEEVTKTLAVLPGNSFGSEQSHRILEILR